MTDNLIKLKSFLEKEEELKQELAERKAEFEESIAQLKLDLNNIGVSVQEAKEAITPEAIQEFKATGKKKLQGGLGIRETKVVSYDTDKAFQFAKEKDMFLMLDDKAFKKAASSLGLDFVKEEKTVIVTFPKTIAL